MKKLDYGCPCPVCGQALTMAGLSGAHLKCANGHFHGRKVKCNRKGCKKTATSFSTDIFTGRPYQLCNDHDCWPMRVK